MCTFLEKNNQTKKTTQDKLFIMMTELICSGHFKDNGNVRENHLV